MQFSNKRKIQVSIFKRNQTNQKLNKKKMLYEKLQTTQFYTCILEQSPNISL